MEEDRAVIEEANRKIQQFAQSPSAHQMREGDRPQLPQQRQTGASKAGAASGHGLGTNRG